MRLLDRYLLRELLIPLSYCLSGFLLFWISCDLFMEIDKFQRESLSAFQIARYYVYRAPELLVEVIPITLLLALLYALTNHSRYHELTAIRAAGVSLWRLSLPYLAVGVIASLGLFALNELVVPPNTEIADAILGRKHLTRTSQGRIYKGLHFRNTRDGRIWNIEAFNVDTYEILRPQVSWDLPNGNRRSLFATNAIRTNDIWVFYGVQEITYPPKKNDQNNSSRETLAHPEKPTLNASNTNTLEALTNTNEVEESATSIGEIPESFSELALRGYTRIETNVLEVPEFTESPEQIKSEIKMSRLTGLKAAKEGQLSLEEILHYIDLHPNLTPRNHAVLTTQLHNRLAYPWTCLVVVLIAIPFGAPSGRRNAFVGVASSIFICFSYFILMRFGLALGTSQIISPVLAAWLPNILFASAGIWLTSRVR